MNVRIYVSSSARDLSKIKKRIKNKGKVQYSRTFNLYYTKYLIDTGDQ